MGCEDSAEGGTGHGRRGVEMSDVSVELGGDQVATVELHRPPNNFFDVALISEIADAYEDLQTGPCRAIVLVLGGPALLCRSRPHVGNRANGGRAVRPGVAAFPSRAPGGRGGHWRGDRGRSWAGVVGRLSSGQRREPVLGQLLAARLSPRLRPLGDPARGGRPTVGRMAALQRRANRGRRGALARAVRPAGPPPPTTCGPTLGRWRSSSPRPRRCRCGRSGRRCDAACPIGFVKRPRSNVPSRIAFA